MANSNSKGSRKHGRKERKLKARFHPISLYVREIITASQYFKATGQKFARI
jgi:hypothetical protein